MRSGTIAFLSGVVACQQLAILPDLLPAGAVIALGVLAAVALRAWPPAALGAGFLWALMNAQVLLAHRLPPALEQTDLVVLATVVSVPVRAGRALRFLADTRLRSPQPGWHGAKRLRLSWYEPPADPLPGERWQLVVRLRRPHGLMNPGGFDYERWLFAEHVAGVGYVRRALGGPSRVEGVHGRLDRWRARSMHGVLEALSGRRFAGIVAALSLGIRSEVPARQWRTLRRTGTSHLMAISGLHVGLAATAGFLLASTLARWAGSARFGPSAPQVGAVGAFGAAALYAGAAGFGLPTQRALVMVGVAALALCRRQRSPPSAVLAAALLAVLAWDPLAVLAGGFWLSFGAVAVLLYTGAARAGWSGRWRRWLLPQLAIGLGLAPLVLLEFGAVPLLGPLANVVAIPWVSFVVVPLAVLGTVVSSLAAPLGHALLRASESAVALLWPYLELFAHAHAPLYRAPIGLAAALVGALGAAVVLAPRGLPGRWVGMVALAPLVLGRAARPGPDEAWLTVLDVGQGLAVVVETERRVLVYDAGPRFGERSDAGSAVVVPFLRAHGWQAVDTVVLSHADHDHIGGFRSLAAAVPVGRVLTNVSGVAPRARRCVRGVRWWWGGVRFEVVHPVDPRRWDRNDGSCVLLVVAGTEQALLTGDLERPGEVALVAREREALGAQVLLVPHHGSDTSTSPAFLAAVGPSVALISDGYRNRYHMPSPAVVGRLHRAGARVFRTDSGGALRVVLGAAPPRAGEARHLPMVERYRETVRRYWHAVTPESWRGREAFDNLCSAGSNDEPPGDQEEVACSSS